MLELSSTSNFSITFFTVKKKKKYGKLRIKLTNQTNLIFYSTIQTFPIDFLALWVNIRSDP